MRNVTILSDSLAAIKAFNSNVMNSKTVNGCRRYLHEIGERYDIYMYGCRSIVVFRVTAELMYDPGGARLSNTPMLEVLKSGHPYEDL